jgi:hypothetical protein
LHLARANVLYAQLHHLATATETRHLQQLSFLEDLRAETQQAWRHMGARGWPKPHLGAGEQEQVPEEALPCAQHGT